MPELPEIETVRKDINRLATGRLFSGVEIRDDKVARFTKAEFEKKIKDQKLKEADRRAKILLLKTVGRFGLMIHFKMTGQLIFVGKDGQQEGGGHPDKAYLGKKLPHKFTKIIFRFKDGSNLYFNDIRRFGWIKIIEQNNLQEVEEIAKLGPEPFSDQFSLDYLKNVFARRKRSNVKSLLMDQKEIAGIGNIYACESLYVAGIDPRRKAGDLNKDETKRVYEAIKKVLKKAICLKGTSSDTYLDAEGKKGGYGPQAYVYGREGEECQRKKCSGKIKKIKISGRGTYFCPQCQA